MTKDEIFQLVKQAGFSVENGHVFANNEAGPEHVLCTNAMNAFVKLLEDAIYKKVYEIALFAPFKESADLIMTEIDEDPDSADDFFKSAEFRYCMNNAVKATTFTICSAIRARGQT
jgi:hypothetical protein